MRSKSDTRYSAEEHRIIQRRESISGSRKFSRPRKTLAPSSRPGYETANRKRGYHDRRQSAAGDKVFAEHRKNKAGQLRRRRALEKYNRNNKLPRTMARALRRDYI